MCLPTSLPSHAGQAHFRKQVSYPCPRLAPSATTSYILGTARSSLLQEAFSTDLMQGFEQIFSDPGMKWESRHPLVFMCRRYLNCAVSDSSGLLTQSVSPPTDPCGKGSALREAFWWSAETMRRCGEVLGSLGACSQGKW